MLIGTIFIGAELNKILIKSQQFSFTFLQVCYAPENMPKDSTNPIGPDTHNLSVNIPKWLHNELLELAGKSGLKIGPYSQAVLVDVTRNRLIAKNPRGLLRHKKIAFDNVVVEPEANLEASLAEERRQSAANAVSPSTPSPGAQPRPRPPATTKPGGDIDRGSSERRGRQRKRPR